MNNVNQSGFESDSEIVDNESDNVSDNDSSYVDETELIGSAYSDEEMETVDVTDNMLYLVLSAFLEDDESKTVVEHLGSLTEAVNSNTVAVNRVADQLGGMLNILSASITKEKTTKSSGKKRVKNVSK